MDAIVAIVSVIAIIKNKVATEAIIAIIARSFMIWFGQVHFIGIILIIVFRLAWDASNAHRFK